jgi:hypothetical protein
MVPMVYIQTNRILKKGGLHASVLCKVPRQEGHEGCQGDHHEEW